MLPIYSELINKLQTKSTVGKHFGRSFLQRFAEVFQAEVKRETGIRGRRLTANTVRGFQRGAANKTQGGSADGTAPS